MINVILCGGSGTRLWPLSRAMLPKQFVKIFGSDSLFTKTLRRLKNATNDAKNIIICNENHYFLATDECESQNLKANFILEPFGRNTAAAIVFAALQALNDDENAIVLVTPSDHIILNENAFKNALNEAIKLANDGKIVTFGIKPNEPNTGYGYIKAKQNEVSEFVEKPDLKTAQEFVKSGQYFYNSGMFCFKAKVFLDELKIYAHDTLCSAKNAYENAKSSRNLARILPGDMDKIPDISIDYALMQKTNKIAMVALDAGWSDLGSFDELAKHLRSSAHESVGGGENFVYSHKLAALVDVRDLIVIDTKDALLIAQKGSSQKVKDVYNLIAKNHAELTQIHTKAYRPWGSYEVLEEGEGFKIKKIIVKSGARLSLQKHSYRSEHWIVVAGEASVRIENTTRTLYANQSTYIAPGQIHRLENTAKTPLVLIEVQVGSYLGEDDIIRIEDDYKRD